MTILADLRKTQADFKGAVSTLLSTTGQAVVGLANIQLGYWHTTFEKQYKYFLDEIGYDLLEKNWDTLSTNEKNWTAERFRRFGTKMSAHLNILLNAGDPTNPEKTKFNTEYLALAQQYFANLGQLEKACCPPIILDLNPQPNIVVVESAPSNVHSWKFNYIPELGPSYSPLWNTPTYHRYHGRYHHHFTGSTYGHHHGIGAGPGLQIMGDLAQGAAHGVVTLVKGAGHLGGEAISGIGKAGGAAIDALGSGLGKAADAGKAVAGAVGNGAEHVLSAGKACGECACNTGESCGKCFVGNAGSCLDCAGKGCGTCCGAICDTLSKPDLIFCYLCNNASCIGNCLGSCCDICGKGGCNCDKDCVKLIGGGGATVVVVAGGAGGSLAPAGGGGAADPNAANQAGHTAAHFFKHGSTAKASATTAASGTSSTGGVVKTAVSFTALGILKLAGGIVYTAILLPNIIRRMVTDVREWNIKRRKVRFTAASIAFVVGFGFGLLVPFGGPITAVMMAVFFSWAAQRITETYYKYQALKNAPTMVADEEAILTQDSESRLEEKVQHTLSAEFQQGCKQQERYKLSHLEMQTLLNKIPTAEEKIPAPSAPPVEGSIHDAPPSYNEASRSTDVAENLVKLANTASLIAHAEKIVAKDAPISLNNVAYKALNLFYGKYKKTAQQIQAREALAAMKKGDVETTKTAFEKLGITLNAQLAITENNYYQTPCYNRAAGAA